MCARRNHGVWTHPWPVQGVLSGMRVIDPNPYPIHNNILIFMYQISKILNIKFDNTNNVEENNITQSLEQENRAI